MRDLMLKERELRLSEEAQEKFRESEAGGDGGSTSWLQVVEQLQEYLIEQCSHILPHQRDSALHQCQIGHVLFPSLAGLSIQSKFNRAGPCPVSEGTVLCSDIPLASVDSSFPDTSLFSFLDNPSTKRVGIVTGSHS
uniref:Uncharacterized protein n=1 Tax=Chromera velia CCMP2878 TaxID=1169474 RepID=A0A0G4I7G2_9ALVE|eukprot:Cvel_11627.t1-p1 / transcript=Cvel_11627.t1 / gene=Cvel_11627 / organism=Chromera_velia_CCMP2878 / gene_product=hypothetical protein / transcript_product=hypothetical protein / location=Cvel_scaffold736:54045-54452(-) / protein_length=136 / sequence_SO=supercontig / SO=protein_coding / is_pseudo=false